MNAIRDGNHVRVYDAFLIKESIKEIDGRFLQLYLNEYCWKFNRRFFRDSTDPKYDLFDRLVKNSASYTSDVKWRDYTPGMEEEEEL